jgi:hypothetical protein
MSEAIKAKAGVTPMPDDDFHKIGPTEYSEDLVIGADKIATLLYGTPEKARRVFHLASTSNSLPIVRHGSQLAIRKSVLRAIFWAQERKAFNDNEDLVRLGVLLQRLDDHIASAHQGATTPRDVKAWRLLLIETARTLHRITKPGETGA